MIAPSGRFANVSSRAFSLAALSSNFGASDSLGLICSGVNAGATGPETLAAAGIATISRKARLQMRFMAADGTTRFAGPCLRRRVPPPIPAAVADLKAALRADTRRARLQASYPQWPPNRRGDPGTNAEG